MARDFSVGLTWKMPEETNTWCGRIQLKTPQKDCCCFVLFTSPSPKLGKWLSWMGEVRRRWAGWGAGGCRPHQVCEMCLSEPTEVSWRARSASVQRPAALAPHRLSSRCSPQSHQGCARVAVAVEQHSLGRLECLEITSWCSWILSLWARSAQRLCHYLSGNPSSPRQGQRRYQMDFPYIFLYSASPCLVANPPYNSCQTII